MDQGTPGIDWTRIDEGVRGFWQLVDELYRVEPSKSDVQHVRHILQTQPMPEAVRRCLKDALPKKEPTQRFAAERFEPKNEAAITKPSTLCVLPPEELDTIEEVPLPTQELPKLKVKEYGPDVSGLLAQPQDAVMYLVPPGPHDFRLGTSTYREVDVSTTIELLRRGILLGMEVRTGGNWVPVTAHPAFQRLIESVQGETERVLNRLLPDSITQPVEPSNSQEITAPSALWDIDIDVDTLKSVDSLVEDELEVTEDQQITAELTATNVAPPRRRPPDKEPSRPFEVIKESSESLRILPPNETAELSRGLIRTTESLLVVPPRRVQTKPKTRFLWPVLGAVLVGLAGLLAWYQFESRPIDAAPLATTTNPFVVQLAKRTLVSSLPETSSQWWRTQADEMIEESPQGALEIYRSLSESNKEDADLLLVRAQTEIAVGDLSAARKSALQGLGAGAERQQVLELLKKSFEAESAPEFEDIDLAKLGRARVLKNSIVFENEGVETHLILPDGNQGWLSYIAASRYFELLGMSTGFKVTPVRFEVATLDQTLPRSQRGSYGKSGTIHAAMYTVEASSPTPIPLELKDVWLPWVRGERLDDSLGAQLLDWDQVDPESRPDLIERVGTDFGVRDLFAQIQTLFLADFLASSPGRLESNPKRFGKNTTIRDRQLASVQPVALEKRTSRRALWLSNYIGELPPQTLLLLEALEPEIASARIVPDGLSSRGDIDRRLELLWERREQLLK